MKNLKNYKITNRNTKAVIYLTPQETTNFIKKAQTWKYIFVAPEQRKAQRVAKILDNIVILTALIAFCVLIYSYITY